MYVPPPFMYVPPIARYDSGLILDHHSEQIPASLREYFKEHRIIRTLKNEIDGVETQLKRISYRDPTLTQGEVVEDIITTSELLAIENDRMKREISYLQSTVDALEMEKNSEKSADFGGFGPIVGGFDEFGCGLGKKVPKNYSGF